MAAAARLADAALVAGALLMRVLVGLSPYSGASDPPRYGDYEAQRHWMEIALGLPPRQWYDEGAEALARLDQQPAAGGDGGPLLGRPTTTPRHWPLDYPPLSGYQSWLTGVAVRAVEPAAVALGARSRGYESPALKVAMRLTVLLCDLLVFFPAAFWAAEALGRCAPGRAPRRRRQAILAVLLLNPALVLVDHGHFQYNCLSLGLALAAMAALVAQDKVVVEEEEENGRGHGRRSSSSPSPSILPPPRVLAAAVLFTLALCHKQMTLYYAPAFFAHMLGAYCLRRQPTWPRRAAAVAALGAVVAATLCLAFAPVVWGHREGAAGGVLAVLARIFPLRRGLYEDYVANFWCATSVGPLKWRELLPGAAAARAALAATVLAALPAMAERALPPLLLRRRPPPAFGGGGGGAGFLLCCANSAAAFFLFSFQVHEKSVLLPLMPATLLLFAGGGGGVGVAGGEQQQAATAAATSTTTTKLLLRALAVWGPVVACFGMFPLLERDGVAAAYAACIVAYVVVAGGLVDEALREEEQEKEEEEGEEENDDDEQQQQRQRSAALATAAAVVGALALHAARLLYEPPARVPWLHDRLFVTYAFVFIASAAAYLNWLQWGAGACAWLLGRRRRQGRAATAAAAAAKGAAAKWENGSEYARHKPGATTRRTFKHIERS